MFEITVLNQQDTADLLKMNEVVQAVEDVYKMKAQENSVVFPLVFHEFNPGVADMDIKSGWLKDSGVWGLKSVSWYGENPQKGLPALVGLVLVFDDKTGAPLGILDGAHITAMRTGAAGALGAKYLARPDSETLLIVGAGHIAPFLIEATLQLLPAIKDVLIYDAMSDENAQALAAKFANATAVTDIEAATGKSDIIITATPSKAPIIMKEWVKPGTHFSCVGADMGGKQEIDEKLFINARIFGDDIPQCMNVGELELPIATKTIAPEDITGEIGEVILNPEKGRQNNEEITIFDATGTALLDLQTAKLALGAAKNNNKGATIEL